MYAVYLKTRNFLYLEFVLIRSYNHVNSTIVELVLDLNIENESNKEIEMQLKIYTYLSS